MLFSYTIVVNNGHPFEPYLLLINSSFTSRWSESLRMFNLGQIYQNSEAKSQRHQRLLCSLIMHAVSANHSVRCMETFIITNDNKKLARAS